MNHRLSMIAALSENRVIGRDGGLPWKLPDDMAWFKAATSGHAVITGRKNFEVEGGKPLPNRHNIVMTTNQNWTTDQASVAHDLDEALSLVDANDPEPFIVGGQGIYELALPRADRMYLTHVHTVVDGDVYFPAFDASQWDVVDERQHPADARHAYPMTFRTYDRKR